MKELCANCQHSDGAIVGYVKKKALIYCKYNKCNVRLDHVCVSHVDKDGVRVVDKKKS